MGSLEKLYEDFASKAEFFMVYIREAHPSDGWFMDWNEKEGISIADPKTMEEREELAGQSCSLLNISIPCLVDNMDDAVNLAYDAWPERIYVVDEEGKIAVSGGPGPFCFAGSIKTARDWLSRL